MRRAGGGWGDPAEVSFLLSFLVGFTSMVDLFVNRLLFRAGPEVLAHMNFIGIPAVAVIGRVSFTLEQLVLFVILGAASVILVLDGGKLSRFLGGTMIVQLVAAAILYSPLQPDLSWAISVLLIIATAVGILGLISFRGLPKLQWALRPKSELVFLLLLGLSFLMLFYYRASLLLSSIDVALPWTLESYEASIYLVMATSVCAFVYAMRVPSSRFKITITNLAKALVIPTLIVVPILYGLMQSFFMGQVFSLVIAMSTDIVLTFDTVRAVVFFWWFLLAAIFLLFLKGRGSENRFYLQQGLGLVFLLSTTFLFNYPNYLLLATAGVLLICYPLTVHRDG